MQQQGDLPATAQADCRCKRVTCLRQLVVEGPEADDLEVVFLFGVIRVIKCRDGILYKIGRRVTSLIAGSVTSGAGSDIIRGAERAFTGWN